MKLTPEELQAAPDRDSAGPRETLSRAYLRSLWQRRPAEMPAEFVAPVRIYAIDGRNIAGEPARKLKNG